MMNPNLYKSPTKLSGDITPDNLLIYEVHPGNSNPDIIGYTLAYITPNGNPLPLLKPYRHMDRVEFVRKEILDYFHNPLEHHTEEEINQVRSIVKRSLVRTDAIRPVMNTLGITNKKAKAIIAIILNPESYNAFIYGIDTFYRGFDFYDPKVWETGIIHIKDIQIRIS